MRLRVAVLIVGLLALAGCDVESGTVVDRQTTVTTRQVVPGQPQFGTRTVTLHTLIVRSEHGRPVKISVTKAEYGRCSIGTSWPTCKVSERN